MGQLQQLQVTYPSRRNMKKTTLSCDKIKLIKMSDKEKILKKKKSREKTC